MKDQVEWKRKAYVGKRIKMDGKYGYQNYADKKCILARICNKHR